jgi:hypothetical protein
MKINENSTKSMKIHENLRNSKKSKRSVTETKSAHQSRRSVTETKSVTKVGGQSLISQVGGLGSPRKEFCLGLIMVYMYYEFAFQSRRFRVAPKGILFRLDNGVFVL